MKKRKSKGRFSSRFAFGCLVWLRHRMSQHLSRMEGVQILSVEASLTLQSPSPPTDPGTQKPQNAFKVRKMPFWTRPTPKWTFWTSNCCENLLFPVVFYEKSAPPKCCKFQTKRKQQKNANLAPFVAFSMSLLIPLDLRSQTTNV